MPQPDFRIVRSIRNVPAGAALDLACGSGRHALWLASLGWRVTAVDLQPASLPSVRFIQTDLETHALEISPGSWDLIVCWLYWQPDLLASIARGIQDCGIVALAGKTSGRFATSLASYRAALPSWIEIDCGENEGVAWFIARKC